MSHIDQPTDTRTRYAIRLKGKLGESLLGAFPELEPAFRHGDTVLTGQLADQPALHGVLSQIEALGLELVEIWQPTGTTFQRPPTPPPSRDR